MKFKYIRDDDAIWSEVDLRKGTVGKRKNTKIQLRTATHHVHKIKKAKWQDLQSLKDFIPPVYHTFYDNLPYEGDDGDDLLEDEMLYESEDLD